MTKRTRRDDPEPIRVKLVTLLQNFEKELKKKDLRTKVKGLIPACRLLRKLGGALIPRADASAGRDRILYYLLKYPKRIIKGDELMVVSGIQDWPRRVRELRVQFGWAIISGAAAKDMQKEGEFPLEKIDTEKLSVNDYILLSKKQDRDAAHRWHVANEIRRKRMAVRDKILEFLRRNVGTPVTGEELRYVAGKSTEWGRRVRELRTEYGWPIVTKTSGRPDLPVGTYLLEADRQSPVHDRNIPDELRGIVLERDKYKCKKCGWTHAKWNRSDPRHLELHHIKPHARGGKTTKENLKTLCTVCHDVVHRRKKGSRST